MDWGFLFNKLLHQEPIQLREPVTLLKISNTSVFTSFTFQYPVNFQISRDGPRFPSFNCPEEFGHQGFLGELWSGPHKETAGVLPRRVVWPRELFPVLCSVIPLQGQDVVLYF